MNCVVYIDVLFLINLSVNFVLLDLTKRFLKKSENKKRMMLGAIVGAIYSCLIFFPDLNIIYTFFSKIIFSNLIILISFGYKKLHIYLKTFAVFYVISFFLAGITLALVFLINSSDFTVKNGVFYLNLPWRYLLISSAAAYALMKIISDIYDSQKVKIFKQIKISNSQKTITLTGLVDTGNNLTDPITNKPVIVVEYEKIKDIIPDTVKQIWQLNGENIPEKETEFFEKIRIIPFKCVGTKHGVLFGFRFESVEIEEKIFNDVTIGIYNEVLSNHNDYCALINPQFVL